MRRHLLKHLALAVGIVLVAGTTLAQDQVQIIRAQFGLGNQWVDVTSRVQSLVSGQGLNFRVDVDNLRVDPVPNQRKILRLKVRNSRGQIQDLTYPEKSVVKLYVTNGYGAPPYGGPPPGGGYGPGLQITRAQYGYGPRMSDVTGLVASWVRGNRLEIPVSNQTMGGDPAYGSPKSLRVVYFWRGARYEANATEGQTLRIP
jgi:hypothetical protein